MRSALYDVVIVTETWLNATNYDFLGLPGYQNFSIFRSDKRGGGVTILVRDTFSAEVVAQVMSEDVELLYVRVSLTHSKHCMFSMNVIGVYRPPSGDCEQCLCTLNDTISSINTFLSNVVLGGDLNRCSLLPLMEEFSLENVVTFPTRGEAFLDVILTNCTLHYNEAKKSAPIARSDHCVISWTPKRHVANRVLRKVLVADKRQPFMNSFSTELAAKHWTHVLACSSASVCAEMLSSSLISCYTSNIPVRQVAIKLRDPKWMTGKVKDLQNRRNRAFLTNNRILFEQLSVNLERAIRQAKSSASHTNKQGSREWWKRVKDHKPVKSIASLNTLLSTFENDKSAADFFNQALVSRFPQEVTLPSENLLAHYSFENEAITVQEIIIAISKLPTHSAPGPDTLPNWVFKDFAHHLAIPLSHVFSLCLKEGVCPHPFKTGTVVLLPKHNSPKGFNDLRPITLTNSLAKIFERVVLNRVALHMSRTIGPDQHAYKRHHSTCTALTHSMHSWLNFLDNPTSYYIRNLMLDFSKAFDSVEPALVVGKLYSYEFPHWFVTFCWNFLTQRIQRVKVNGTLSEAISTSRGIPQGIILGPSLFCIMINDLQARDPSHSFYTKYADDQSLSYYVSKGQADEMQLEVDAISNWCIENHMIINAAKTKELLISFASSKPTPPALQLGDVTIERVRSYKSLGIVISDDLSWDAHIDYTLSKCHKTFFLIRSSTLANNFGRLDRKHLVESLLFPILSYCYPVWCNLRKKDLKRIDVIYRRAMKFVDNCTLVESHVEEILDRTLLSFFKQCLKETHPLNYLLPKRSLRASRNRHNLIPILKTNTTRFHNHFVVKGTVAFNSLE